MKGSKWFEKGNLIVGICTPKWLSSIYTKLLHGRINWKHASFMKKNLEYYLGPQIKKVITHRGPSEKILSSSQISD